MKNNTHPEFYFSAYPLSVIGGTSQSKLKVTQAPGGVSLKILPATPVIRNNYPARYNHGMDAVQLNDVDWFNNYE